MLKQEFLLNIFCHLYFFFKKVKGERKTNGKFVLKKSEILLLH